MHTIFFSLFLFTFYLVWASKLETISLFVPVAFVYQDNNNGMEVHYILNEDGLRQTRLAIQFG